METQVERILRLFGGEIVKAVKIGNTIKYNLVTEKKPKQTRKQLKRQIENLTKPLF
jgi:hypothetical protein